MIINTHNVKETIQLAENISKYLKKGDVLCLTGDLGTGKTHFSKGIAKGLKVDENITSPTFTIVNEYRSGILPLFHFDVYRVNDTNEILDIGFDEYIYGDGVTLIEWANLIEEILPDNFLHIKIEKTAHENERKFTLTPFGMGYDYIKDVEI